MAYIPNLEELQRAYISGQAYSNNNIMLYEIAKMLQGIAENLEAVLKTLNNKDVDDWSDIV